MKLSHECVRDLLLFLEENLSYHQDYCASNISIDNYSQDEISYTIEKLYEAGFINAYKADTLLGKKTQYIVNDITWLGHNFIDNIRDKKVWKKTKEATSKFTSVSLNILSSIASSVITSMISQSL